jgi:cbb3-type cytochrome oxidase maturation protein
MSVIYIVLPLALIFVVVAVLVFLRLAYLGQFDDLDTPSVRMLWDDEGRRSGSPPDPASNHEHPDKP